MSIFIAIAIATSKWFWLFFKVPAVEDLVIFQEVFAINRQSLFSSI